MQKNSIILIYLLTFIAGVFSSIDINNLAGIPSDVVCAMSICPTQTASLYKRATPCPSVCKDGCVIVDDVCCPGIQKAVCNTTAISTTGSPTQTAVTSSSTALPSTITSSSVSSVSSTTTTASSSPSPNTSPNTSPTIPGSAGSFIQPSITFAVIAIAFCILKLN